MKSINNKMFNKIMLVIIFASLIGCKNIVSSEKNSPEKAASDYINNLISQNNILSGREADYEIPVFFNGFDVAEMDGSRHSFASYSREEKLAMIKAWKEANIQGVAEKLKNNETILSDLIELNLAVEKSIRKASRSALENQKKSFINNYTKELERLIKKEEKARNSSSGSSFNQKSITEDCLIDSSFKKFMKDYEQGRMVHEAGLIGHISMMHLTNKRALEVAKNANGLTEMTITSFPYHNTTVWPEQKDGVQYEPVGYWCGSSEGGAKEVHLIKAVGQYTEFTRCGHWYEFKWPWERIGEKKEINKKAVEYAESRLGVPYIPKGSAIQIPYLDNFVWYKYSDKYSYCSQIVWKSFKSAGGIQYDFDAGSSWISPLEIYLSLKTKEITSWKNKK